jgi:hypothetical protein
VIDDEELTRIDGEFSFFFFKRRKEKGASLCRSLHRHCLRCSSLVLVQCASSSWFVLAPSPALPIRLLCSAGPTCHVVILLQSCQLFHACMFTPENYFFLSFFLIKKYTLGP